MGGVSAVLKGLRSETAAVNRLGTILSEILPAEDPMFLRPRLVAKATSAPPVYGSLEELSHALAYYERPDRTGLIQDVYNRWQNSPAMPAASVLDLEAVGAPPARTEERPTNEDFRRPAFVR